VKVLLAGPRTKSRRASVAVVRARALPRWSAPVALLAGFSFIADGITVGTDGFTGGVPNLMAWVAFILFAVIATIAAWWRGPSDRPTEQGPAFPQLISRGICAEWR